ncbi:MAG: fatty acid desaturase [Planctomycetota bacterium]
MPAATATTSAQPAAAEFSMREARSLLEDLDLRPRLAHYWVDLITSWVGFMICLHLLQTVGLPWWVRAGGFVGAVVLGYRSALFIHEIAHQPADDFRWFRFVWNLLVGIPFMIPTFVYTTHLDHHRRKHYGTSHDGEYLPFGTRPVWHLLGYLGQSFVIPVLAILRFGLLVPLSWFSPSVRDWAHRHASSMIIDPRYCRPLPSDNQLRMIRLQEAACFGFLVVAGSLVVASWWGLGPLEPWLLPWLYAISVTIITINAVRTLGAHRYYYDAREAKDEPMTFTEQLVDSVNYPRWPWLTVLWAPVGLRFHALHHLFPSLPYHVLPAVHDRLMDGLPDDSPYRKTTSRGLVWALADLWRRARAHHQEHRSTPAAA